MPTIREYHPVRIVVAGTPRDATEDDLVAEIGRHATTIGLRLDDSAMHLRGEWSQFVTYDPHHGGACLSWYRDVEVSDEEYARRGQVYQSGREGH